MLLVHTAREHVDFVKYPVLTDYIAPNKCEEEHFV